MPRFHFSCKEKGAFAILARFADGADEVHQWRIAQRTIDAYKREQSTRAATGNLPL